MIRRWVIFFFCNTLLHHWCVALLNCDRKRAEQYCCVMVELDFSALLAWFKTYVCHIMCEFYYNCRSLLVLAAPAICRRVHRALCSSFELAASGCWWMACYRTDTENIHRRIRTHYAQSLPSWDMIIMFPNDFHFLRAKIYNWGWILIDCRAQSTIFWLFNFNNERCLSWTCEWMVMRSNI